MARTVARPPKGGRRGGYRRSRVWWRVTLALACAFAGLPLTASPAVAAAPACRTTAAPGLLVLNGGCGLPVVLYAHAAGEEVEGLLRRDLLDGVARAGFSMVASDLCGPLNWGSRCAVEEMHRLKGRFSPDRPVRVLAMSMGGAALVNFAEAHPDELLIGVGIVPVTTWDTDWLREATGGRQPALPERVKFPYRIFSGADDEVVGRPVVKGPRVSVQRLAGNHDVWQQVGLDAILKALKGSE